MGVSAFPSENPPLVASMIDSMAVNPLQFRPGGAGGSVPQVFNPNDRQDRYWSNMALEQQPHSNGVQAGREALGLGLGMGMGMNMAAMSATMGMGMGMGMGMQQHDHQGSVNFSLRSQAGDKRELMGWSMLGEGVGGVVGVESLAIRNDHHPFFTTSLAPQPTLLNMNSETTEENDVKNENNGVSDGNGNLVSRSEAAVGGRWDFEVEGEQMQQQSTCDQNTEQYADPQQQQQQSTDKINTEHADGDQEKLGGGRVMSVEDSEGQSMDERWSAWEEEKHGLLRQTVFFYRECQRNMAAEKGCTVLDGCCEFMPASSEEEGKPDSLLCAACNCHRSFHRRVLCDKDGFQIENGGQEQEGVRATQDCIAAIKNVANQVTVSINQAVSQVIQKDGKAGDNFPHDQFDQTLNPASFLKCLDNLRKAAKSLLVTADCLTTLQSKAISSSAAVAAAAAAGPNAAMKDGGNSDCSSSFLNQFRNGKQQQHHQHLLTGGVNNGGTAALQDSTFSERKEKRKRTRFSTEQITKLNDFAMEVGWTLAGLSKDDIDAVCENVGIEPTTLKYWLYNTRQKSKRRHQEDEMSQPIS